MPFQHLKVKFFSSIKHKTEVNIVAYIGDTVRLKVNFKTFDGTAIEPEDVKLKFINLLSKIHMS